MTEAKKPRKAPPKTPIRVLLMGHGTLGKALLAGMLPLIKEGICEIVGVFRWSQCDKSDQWMDMEELEFARLVLERGLNELSGTGANDFWFTRELETLKPDCVLVGSWGEILKPHLLNREDLQVINCHPSMLPAHRGANPYASAIRSGDTETGITFHLVDEHIDTGPILMQQAVPITPDDTGESLRARCGQVAGTLVPELIRLLYSRKKLKPLDIDRSRESYFPQLKLSDGEIHWQWDAQEIYNQIRGLYPWLDCYTHLDTVLGSRTMIALNTARMVKAETKKKGHTPGMIVGYDKAGIQVATGDPKSWLLLPEVRAWFLFGFLPPAAMRFLGPVLFGTGKIFKK